MPYWTLQTISFIGDSLSHYYALLNPAHCLLHWGSLSHCYALLNPTHFLLHYRQSSPLLSPSLGTVLAIVMPYWTMYTVFWTGDSQSHRYALLNPAGIGGIHTHQILVAIVGFEPKTNDTYCLAHTKLSAISTKPYPPTKTLIKWSVLAHLIHVTWLCIPIYTTKLLPIRML